MKQVKHIITVFLLLSLTTGAFAHSLWIETDNKGKSGKVQAVKLYFGEFAQNERDNLTQWRSNLADLTLWLVKPDGSKVQLPTSKDSNSVVSNFTPDAKGVYTLVVAHSLKELSGTNQLSFLASTHVLVESGREAINEAANNNALVVYPLTSNDWKVNKTVTVKTLVNNNTKAGNTVLVFSPSGWSQELTTAADGTISFVPLWPGKYVIEAQDYDKTAGEKNGNKYAAHWQGATYSFEVAK